jgi:hypothetical protein
VAAHQHTHDDMDDMDDHEFMTVLDWILDPNMPDDWNDFNTGASANSLQNTVIHALRNTSAHEIAAVLEYVEQNPLTAF